MHKFTFEILFHIIGIGSGSGLLYRNNMVYLISDNGGYLYEYKIDSKLVEKYQLFDSDTLENIPKIIKPDFEAIAEHSDTLYIFGSGSTENRNKMISVDANTKQIIATTDLADLYAVMKSFGEISDEDFNIEGVTYDGESWYFFQRGNGGTGKNGIFTVRGDIAAGDFSVLFNRYKLPKIKGIESSFTDAVIVGDKIYFLATSEDTMSAYDDGDILGSFVGRLDINKMKIDFTKKISNKHKLEGIALHSQQTNEITFLLCEDNDTDGQKSDIFKLVLKI